MKHPGIQSNKGYRQDIDYKNKIRERDGYTCQLCGNPGNQVDHIVPFAISKDSSEGNLRTLCKPCNLSLRRGRKDAALPVDQWYKWLDAELSLASIRSLA